MEYVSQAYYHLWLLSSLHPNYDSSHVDINADGVIELRDFVGPLN